MKSRLSVLFGAVLAVLTISSQSMAVDKVTVKGGGKRFVGEITSMTKTGIVIKTGLKKDVVQNVKANDILRVEWDAEPARLEAARNAEQAGRLQQALDGYNLVSEDPKVTSENLKADLQYFIARTTARMAQGDPTKADAAIALLDGFRKTYGTSFRYYDLLNHLGRTYLVKKDFDNAKRIFVLLGTAPWQDTKLAAQLSEARVLLASDKKDEALTVYETVLSKTGNSALLKSIAIEATLGKGTCLQLKGQNAEAVRVLNSVIERASAADSRTLAGAYTILGDCHSALNQDKDALLAYLHVDILFSNQREFHPRALYHLVRLWRQVGKTTRSTAAQVKLETEYPNSEWKTKK